MERIKELNRYQRIVLILLAVMLAGFAILYAVTYSRVGYAYADHIFIPGEENGNTTYSAKVSGQDAVFTVTDDQTVTLRYGEKVYGPYTAQEDPTAIPDDSQMARRRQGLLPGRRFQHRRRPGGHRRGWQPRRIRHFLQHR